MIASVLATEPEYAAVSPDGKKVFASQFNTGSIIGFETANNQLIGPILTGEGTGGLAFVPDQSADRILRPLPAKIRPGVPATLDGAASTDPDGTIATYAWQFGDGGTETGPSSSATHTYAKPGAYNGALTLTDNEGCSVPLVFTGQTASCHGSPAAAQTQTLQVKYPGRQGQVPEERQAERLQVQAESGEEDRQGQKAEAEDAERRRQGQGQGRQVGDRLAEAEEEVRQEARRPRRRCWSSGR